MEFSVHEMISRAAYWQKENRSFVLTTVIRAEGATPGRIGFKMIVFEDGNIEGTVGGGELERQVIGFAQASFRTKKSMVKEFELVEDKIGMACGGKLSVFLEYFEAPKRIYLFGGGHLAKSLVPVLKSLSFYIIVVDNRIEVANQAVHPLADKVTRADYDAYIESLKWNPNDAFVIFTHGHKHDFSVLSKLLQKNLPYRYLGMIGSKEKVNIACSKLSELDISQEQIDSIFAPIGLNIARRTTQEIAIAIAAEIIAVYNDVSEIKHMREN